MNRSSIELKEEITENLRFLQRQMKVHYGHRSTFRPDATVQFLAKVVGLTRQLNEQWTRYVELDSTIRKEFPEKLPNRPEAGRNEGAISRHDLIQPPENPDRPLFKEEKPRHKTQFRARNRATPGNRPNEERGKPDIIPADDSTDDTRSHGTSWSERTTTTTAPSDQEG